MWKRFGSHTCEVWLWGMLAVVLMIFALFFATAEVSGTSMYPTCRNKDFLILRREGQIHNGDIVAVYSDKTNSLLLKRVIGVAGDTVSVHSSKVMVNGVEIYEPYLNTDLWAGDADVVVPDDSIFVMGDNRGNSLDSRDLGCLSISGVAGASVLNLTKMFGLNKISFKVVVILLWATILVSGVFRKNDL